MVGSEKLNERIEIDEEVIEVIEIEMKEKDANWYRQGQNIEKDENINKQNKRKI